MDKNIRITKMSFMLMAVPAVYALLSIVLLAHRFNYSLYLPTMYRVMYVPAYFWILYTAYLVVTHRVFLKNRIGLLEYMRHGAAIGIFFNLYLLLGNLIFTLFRDQGQLHAVYFGYIKAVFLLATTGLITASAKKIFIQNGRKLYGILIYSQFFIAAAYFFCLGLMARRPDFAALVAMSCAAGIALRGIDTVRAFRLPRGIFANTGLLLLAIFLVSFSMRLAFGCILVNKTTHGPYGYDGYLYASDDGLTYDAVANKILKDPSIIAKGEVALWGNWDQFYSVFLAGVYKIFGRNFYVVALIQSVFGALIPMSIFLIAELLFSRTVAFIASMAVAFKGGLISLSSYMGHEAIWLPLLYVFIFMLTRYYKRPKRSSFLSDIVMGVVLGVVSLFRSLYFYFVPVLCIWEMLFFLRIKIVRRVIHLAIVLACSVCIIAPAAYIFGNKIPLMNKDKADILWSASRPVSPPFQNIGNERLEAEGINIFRDVKGSFNTIIRDPVKFIGLAGALYPLRIIAYFESYQFGFFDPIYMLNPAKVSNAFASTLEFYLTVFFVVGLGACFVTKDALRSPVFLLLAFHVLFFSVLLFQPAPRLKETSSPMIYLIGSVGAVRAFQFFNKVTTEKDGAI